VSVGQTLAIVRSDVVNVLKTQMPFIKTQLLITTDLKMPLKPVV
jgi:hypothetical protein